MFTKNESRTRRVACLGLGLVVVVASAMAGCSGPERDVRRVDPQTRIDLDYRFDDEDAREVYQAMADDALFRGWIDRWIAEHGGQRPIMIVGGIQNNTQEYINTNLFTRNFERELLNSGRVRVVAMRDQRGELRDERLQGQEWNSAETRKVMRNELGADLMLMGDINEVRERSLSGNRITTFFQVNLDLINLETNEKVWIGNHEIKKFTRIR